MRDLQRLWLYTKDTSALCRTKGICNLHRMYAENTNKQKKSQQESEHGGTYTVHVDILLSCKLKRQSTTQGKYYNRKKTIKQQIPGPGQCKTISLIISMAI